MSARLPQRARICASNDFNRVLQHPELRIARAALIFFARANQLQYARLGVVVGKKKTALSVQRSRIKRLVRESFRSRAHTVPGVDLVVLVRGEIKARSNRKIFQDLDFLWRQLQQENESAKTCADARMPPASD